MFPPSAWSLANRAVTRRPRPHTDRLTLPVTIRRSRPEDRRSLTALAALDSAPPLEGEALVAEVGGRPVAATDLASGRTIAGPFTRTAEIAGLLRVRVGQLGR